MAALLLQQPGLNVEAVKLSRQLGALQLFVQHQQRHKEGTAAGEDPTNHSTSRCGDVNGFAAASIGSKLQELGFKLRAQESASAAADWQKLQQLAALVTADSSNVQQTVVAAGANSSSHCETTGAHSEAAAVGCCSNSITGATSHSSSSSSESASCCNAATSSGKPAATNAITAQAALLNTSSSSSSSGEVRPGAPEAPAAVRVQVAVGGMTCSMCAAAVEDVLKKVRSTAAVLDNAFVPGSTVVP
jgi:hypothetical protein